jgi:hypothetical protein
MLKEIVEMYYGNQLPTIADANFIEMVSKIFGHSWFQMPALLTGVKLSEKAISPIFAYSYEHEGSFTFCDLLRFNLGHFGLKVNLLLERIFYTYQIIFYF